MVPVSCYYAQTESTEARLYHVQRPVLFLSSAFGNINYI